MELGRLLSPYEATRLPMRAAGALMWVGADDAFDADTLVVGRRSVAMNELLGPQPVDRWVENQCAIEALQERANLSRWRLALQALGHEPPRHQTPN